MNTRKVQNMIDGFRENFFLLSNAQYVPPDSNGFAHDRKNLREDGERVAAGLRRNVERVEKTEKPA
ncbi:MAG: hypothetical protein LBF61_06015 [Azoarcus sp.]|jgi:hypothetical protein|nr:hypothetical protein [Azoarcus sp.]